MSPKAPVLLLLLAALAGGCADMRAEMREPPAFSRIPPGLGVNSGDPVPAMAANAAAAMDGAGRSLRGDPAATARAVGQLEIVSEELRRNPRWAPLPTAVETELRTARLEWRAALGIRSGADADAVAASLGQSALAQGQGRGRDAAAALDPALFEPGGAVTLARLAAPGPLPQSQIASALVRDEMARFTQLRMGGTTGALDPNAGLLGGPGGAVAPQYR